MRKRFDSRATVTASLLLLMLLGVSLVILSGHLPKEVIGGTGRSWLGSTSTLAERFALGKSNLVRHWAAPAVVVLMLLSGGLALGTILRERP
jgi:hypothetical protein